ncbi:hypothetical protein KUTeg_010121 [Tegillarca granosa]|uniref:Uncharacterized protein n=1 Tax=Tegillarca granosa TaxID=220873 RepID=A0ABQ9FAT2_TEGGR|nr:hypothetical protein KUTeg_010121 [Tegillarca granosa]
MEKFKIGETVTVGRNGQKEKNCKHDKKGGKEYEPSTLRGMLVSFERYLRRHKYSTSIISGFEFSKCRESLKSKQKDPKSKGFGNRLKTADAITQDEIDTLYKCGLLGNKTPEALLNTL